MTTADRRAAEQTLVPLQDTFVVREHVGLFKAASNYDVLDPATGQPVLLAREERLGPITKLLRFTDFKTRTPFEQFIRSPDGTLVLRVSRGVTLLRSTVEVHDGAGRLLGTFQQKLLSIGGAFDIHEPGGRIVASLKGKWTGWDFRFLAGTDELARVTKKWAGLGRELLTSADSYVLQIAPATPRTGSARALILAAVLCIDMVLKE